MKQNYAPLSIVLKLKSRLFENNCATPIKIQMIGLRSALWLSKNYKINYSIFRKVILDYLHDMPD